LFVDRYYLPVRRIEYANVDEIGLTVIATRRGRNVPLMGIKNTVELHKMFDAAIDRGAMSESVSEGSLVVRELAASAALGYSLLPAIAISVALSMFRPRWLTLDGRIVFMIVYLVVFSVVYGVLRGKSA
jgi:hypothetical protein